MGKKLVFFIAAAITAVLIGVVPDPPKTRMLFHQTGWYVIALAFFLWAGMIIRVYGKKWKPFLSLHKNALILALFLGISIFLASPPKFKVLMDEANLVAVSKVMAEQRVVSIPTQGFFMEFAGETYGFIPNKRPLLFPLVTSLIHTFTGYRAVNGMAVNFAAMVLVLFCTYLLVLEFAPKLYGYAAMLITAALPCLTMYGTSSGFEMLNLLFILLAFLFLHAFMKENTSGRAEVFFLTLVLLAQCRYESVVFCIAAIILIPVLSTRKLVNTYSPVTPLCTFLLIPVLWQQRIFSSILEPVKIGADQFQFGKNLFSISHFLDHIPGNLAVLSGIDPKFGFSPVITLSALIGMVLFIRYRMHHSKDTDTAGRYEIVYGIASFLILTGLIFSYFWGDFTRKDANRFAVIYIPVMSVFSTITLYTITRKIRYNLRKMVIFTGLVFHLAIFLPIGSADNLLGGTYGFSLRYEYEKAEHFLKTTYTSDDRDILVISQTPTLYLIQNHGSISFQFAKKNMPFLKSLVEKFFDHTVVLRKHRYGAESDYENFFQKSGLIEVPVARLPVSYQEYLQVTELRLKKPSK